MTIDIVKKKIYLKYSTNKCKSNFYIFILWKSKLTNINGALII